MHDGLVSGHIRKSCIRKPEIFTQFTIFQKQYKRLSNFFLNRRHSVVFFKEGKKAKQSLFWPGQVLRVPGG